MPQVSQMGITIPKTLHIFLSKNGGIGKDVALEIVGDVVRIDQLASVQILNGIALSITMPAMCDSLGLPLDGVREHLSVLQGGNTPQTRLANWNTILSILDRGFGMKISNDAKALLVAGDLETVLKLYDGFRRRCIVTNARSRLQPAANGVGVAAGAIAGNATGHATAIMKIIENAAALDQINADQSVLPATAKSPMELIIITMCQSLSIRPDQATALLTTNAHYLGHMFARGMGGSFDGLLKWCHQLVAHAGSMCTLLRNDNSVIPMVMHTLRLGMFSPNVNIVSSITSFFVALISKLESSSSREIMWNWFVLGPGGVGVNTGLHGVLAALKTHRSVLSGVRPGMWQLLNLMVSGPSDVPISTRAKANSRGVSALLCKHLREMLPNPVIYMNAVNEMLMGMISASEDVHEAAKKEGAARQLIEFTLAHADSTRLTEEQSMFKAAENNVDIQKTRERIAALELNVQLWITFAEVFDEIPQATRLALSLLKKGVADESVELQVASVTLLFHLLDNLAEKRHAFAPYLYKSLIFALIGSADNEALHEYLLFNMIITLEKFSNIPIGVLIEPLIKQVAKEGYNNLFFDLFAALAMHDRLDIDAGGKMANLLGQIALNDIIFGKLAMVPFIHIMKRFLEGKTKQIMQDYIVNFMKLSLKAFLTIQINIMKHGETDDSTAQQSLPIELMNQILEIGRISFSLKTATAVEKMLGMASKQYTEITRGKHHEGFGALVGFAMEIIIAKEGETNMMPEINAFDTASSSDEVASPCLENADDDKRMANIKKVFELIDTNGDGYISKPEMRHGINENRDVIRLLKAESSLQPLLYPKHWEETFDAMDPSSGNGDVELDWFIEFATNVHQNATAKAAVQHESIGKSDEEPPELASVKLEAVSTARKKESPISFGKEIDDALQEIHQLEEFPRLSNVEESPQTALKDSVRTPSPGPSYAFRTPPEGSNRRKKNHQTKGAFMTATEWQVAKRGAKRDEKTHVRRSLVNPKRRSASVCSDTSVITTINAADFDGISGIEHDDLAAAESMFKRWDSQMRHAYDSYADSKVNRDNDAVTFDHMKAGRSYLKFKHWMIMLRDYDILPAYIKQKPLKLIWNKVCFGRLQTIDYPHFLLCMRVLVLYHDKTKYGERYESKREYYATLSGRPESRGVDGLMGHMCAAAIKRYSSWHSRVWENERDDIKMPKGCEPAVWSPKKVKLDTLDSLNETLRRDSNAELPPGVVKQHVNVRLLPKFFDRYKDERGDLSDAVDVSLNILNDLLLKNLDISVLGNETKIEARIHTSMMSYAQKSKKKPKLQKVDVYKDPIVPASELDEVQLAVRKKMAAHPKVSKPSTRLYQQSSVVPTWDNKGVKKTISFGTCVSPSDKKCSKGESFAAKAAKKKMSDPVLPETFNRLYPYAKPAEVNDSEKEKSPIKSRKKKKEPDVGPVKAPEADPFSNLPAHLKPLKPFKQKKKEEEEKKKLHDKRDRQRREKRQQELRQLMAQKAAEKLQKEADLEAKKLVAEERKAQRELEERENRIREKRRIMKFKEKRLRKFAEERAIKLQEELERREESNDAILIKAERARRAAARAKQNKDEEMQEKEQDQIQKEEELAIKRNAMADAARRRVAERKALVENLSSVVQPEDGGVEA
jgi:hypothetical protein